MTNTKRSAEACIRLAAKHLDNGAAMASSATLCHADAVKAYYKGNLNAAGAWALEALAYGVGIFHPDYRAAAELVGTHLASDKP